MVRPAKGWFWRRIETRQHARAVLTFAAAIFAVNAVLELSGAFGELTQNKLFSALLFGASAICMMTLRSRIAAIVMVAYCGLASAGIGMSAYVYFNRGDRTYIWALLFFALSITCTLVALRALSAAMFLHRQPIDG